MADISPVERRETTGRGFATQYAPHAHCATLVMTDTYTCGNLRICTVPNRRYLLLYAFTKKGACWIENPGVVAASDAAKDWVEARHR